MNTAKKYYALFKMNRGILIVHRVTLLLFILTFSLITSGCQFVPEFGESADVMAPVDPDYTNVALPQTDVPVETIEPIYKRESGYIASLTHEATYFDADGTPLGTLPRGTHIDYDIGPNGKIDILLNGSLVYLQEGNAKIVSEPTEIVIEHTLYIRSSVNLRTVEGKILSFLAEKGNPVNVIGCDYVDKNGKAHMYRVEVEGNEGYIMPWYLTETETDALANYDDGNYYAHANRDNRYGGGGAADLDYYPREKGPIEGNEMPKECRTLYIETGSVRYIDSYIAIAQKSGINAFVVDITDGGAIGFASEVMKEQCPTAASAARYTVEEYRAAIQKIKDAGYYVIGRITTFNDTYFIKDHPEYAISDKNGAPLQLHGVYWPTAYNRNVWQYKVDLAVEAVKLMGFNEIQFDYVRFPDMTWSYEAAGTIDYRNTYGESKAQAIQRFLMYATDILHENGAYVSADVYGESSNAYVTAYGQYWPAISNIVDVISGMPYPDHFSEAGTWKPWEHPYETLYSWGKSVMLRQNETATPAAVRTWIQAYNAIRPPYNVYGANEIADQIRGLRNAGCTGGYMTWNASSSIGKYTALIPAFAAPNEK